jgi:hypothetical protein
MTSMFSLGQRLKENPSIDFSRFSGNAGMYVKLVPVKGKEKRAVTDLILQQIPCPVRPGDYLDDAHITVIWSRVPVRKSEILGVCDAVCQRFPASVVGADYWPGHDNVGYLVLNVKSDGLVNLHDILVKLGAQHSFPTYEPHITLAAKIGALTPRLGYWLEQVNSALQRRPLPLMFSSVSFSDLWD